MVVCFDSILLHLKYRIHVMSIYHYWLGSLKGSCLDSDKNLENPPLKTSYQVERTKHLKYPTKYIPNSLFDSSHYVMANA